MTASPASLTGQLNGSCAGLGVLWLPLQLVGPEWGRMYGEKQGDGGLLQLFFYSWIRESAAGGHLGHVISTAASSTQGGD